jgi:uncharacterized 2Fe-2S/4Fe-4S cluster protein (DUF4445 family)
MAQIIMKMKKPLLYDDGRTTLLLSRDDDCLCGCCGGCTSCGRCIVAVYLFKQQLDSLVAFYHDR